MTDTAADEPIPVCRKCDRQHVTRTGAQACTAHKGNGDPCSKFPIHGGRVCDTHGGRAPQVQQVARENLERREIEMRLASALVSIGTPPRPDEHPVDGLLHQITLARQAVDFYAYAIAELNLPDPNDTGPFAEVLGVDDDGDPILRQPHSMIYGRTHTGDLGVHPLVKLWNDERERHARICKMAIDAGISERLVRMAENTGMQIAVVIAAVIDAMDLPDEKRREARALAGQKLRELTAPVIDADGG